MPFRTSDTLTGSPRGSVEQAFKYIKTRQDKRAFTEEYIKELWRLGVVYKIDPAVAFAQFCDETASGTSSIWYSSGNPAGIGVMDGGVRVDVPYKTGKDAARAHMVHLHVYIYGRIPMGSELRNYISLDPRYEAALAAYGGRAKTIQDLAGRWATNPNYANQIVGHANNAFVNPPTDDSGTAPPPTGDNMAEPKIIDKFLHVAQDGYAGVNRRYIGANKRKIIVLHIQEGTNWGSWQHFHSVSASSTVFVGRNGDIWNLVPESDGPWTNGDVCSPTAKGRDLINRYGGDPNYYSLTIETEGFASSNNSLGWAAWPKPQAQLDSVVWLIKHWMQKYDIPIENVVRHADINQCSRPGCPGDTFYNYVINAIKTGSGSVDEKPEYAATSPVLDKDGKKWDGTKDLTVGTATFHAEKRKVKTEFVGVFRSHATRNAGRTRADMQKGRGFSVLGWVNGEEVSGERRWWITSNFSRIHVSATVEKPKAEQLPIPEPDVEEPQPDEFPDLVEYGPVILNARAYYPVEHVTNSEVKAVKVVVTEKEAKAYRTVSTSAPVHKTFKRGDELEVTHFVVGDKVDGESVWWVIDTDEGNPLHKGLRIPAAHTNLRPSIA